MPEYWQPELVERLNANASYMRLELQGLGFDIGESETSIIPIIIGDDMRTIFTWKALFENGVFVNPILARRFQRDASFSAPVTWPPILTSS